MRAAPNPRAFTRAVWGLTSRPPVPVRAFLRFALQLARPVRPRRPPSSGYPSSGVLRFSPFGRRCPVRVPRRLPLGFPSPSATSTLALSPGGPAGVGPVRPGLRSRFRRDARPRSRRPARNTGPGQDRVAARGPSPLTLRLCGDRGSRGRGPPSREAHGSRLPRDRLLTVDCGQRGRALWTGAHVMDWRYAAHLQLRTIVPGPEGSRRTAGSGSQADSAGSIPVTRSTF